MASEIFVLKATARPRAGKGAARQARRDGNIPAVIYGDKKTPETIAIEYNSLWKQILKGHFTASVFDIDIADKGTIRVIPRDVQVDPVKDFPIHVDFLRIGDDGIIRVAVPVRFVNEAASPGLKRGGVLNVVRHEVEVLLPLRSHSSGLRDQSGRLGNRHVDPHLVGHDAGRCEPGDLQSRLHDRDDCRRAQGRRSGCDRRCCRARRRCEGCRRQGRGSRCRRQGRRCSGRRWQGRSTRRSRQEEVRRGPVQADARTGLRSPDIRVCVCGA